MFWCGVHRQRQPVYSIIGNLQEDFAEKTGNNFNVWVDVYRIGGKIAGKSLHFPLKIFIRSLYERPIEGAS